MHSENFSLSRKIKKEKCLVNNISYVRLVLVRIKNDYKESEGHFAKKVAVYPDIVSYGSLRIMGRRPLLVDNSTLD